MNYPKLPRKVLPGNQCKSTRSLQLSHRKLGSSKVGSNLVAVSASRVRLIYAWAIADVEVRVASPENNLQVSNNAYRNVCCGLTVFCNFTEKTQGPNRLNSTGGKYGSLLNLFILIYSRLFFRMALNITSSIGLNFSVANGYSSPNTRTLLGSRGAFRSRTRITGRSDGRSATVWIVSFKHGLGLWVQFAENSSFG